MTFFKGLLCAVVLAMTLPTVSVAQANTCDSPVVDNAGIISDVGKVTSTAQKLGNAGADVRIVTTNTLGSASNMDEFERTMQSQCPSWTSGNHRKSSLLVIMFNPKSLDIGVYYGVALVSKLDQVQVKIRTEALRPAVLASRNGEKDAYTKAFVSMLNNFNDVLSTSAAASNGSTTIIHQEASDSSWFGRMVIGVVAIIGIGVLVIFLIRTRADKGDVKAVQAETRRVRSGCLNRLIAITDDQKHNEIEALILAAKPRLSAGDATKLQTTFETYLGQAGAALAAFGRFDDVSKDDPNVDGLPASAYRSNQQAYEDIIAGSIEPAEASLKTISALLERAQQARVA